MQRGNELLIELEERLAARTDDVLAIVWLHVIGVTVGPLVKVWARNATGPTSVDRIRKRRRPREFAAVGSGADEIGVAELTDRAGAILLAARPQVTAGESAEHCCPSCLCAFTL